MDGIMVGADLAQDWILPWWWGHYRRHNSYPLIFIDLGMSFEMKDWCKARGEYLRLRELDFAVEKEEIAPQIVQKLEGAFGTQFWDCRNAWLKKPLACLKSPFQRTLWIDLDCEIRGSLEPLFAYADPPPGLAMAKDQHDPPDPYPIYNSGVIAFRPDAPILQEWARWCVERNSTLRGDQEVFSQLVGEQKIPIPELPPLYNWSRCNEGRPDAMIRHWHGVHGKWVIRHEMQREELS